MLDLLTGDSGSTSAAPTAATADGAQKLISNCKAVLRPYRKQSVTVTSIIAVGDVWLRAGDSASAGDEISAGTNDEALLTLLSSDPNGGFARVDRIKLPPAQSGTDTFGTLKRRARQLSNAGPSGQLLLLSAQMLERMITPLPRISAFARSRSYRRVAEVETAILVSGGCSALRSASISTSSMRSTG
jgi:hypothetical protein